MEQRWYLIYGYALASAFVLSLILTALVRRFALSRSILDHPGERKMQRSPIPLLGGVAIFSTFCLVVLGNFVLLGPLRHLNFTWFEVNVFNFLGDQVQLKLTGIFAGSFLIFLLGIVDDLKALSPELKLVGQIAAAIVLAACGIRIDLFVTHILSWSGLDTALSEVAIHYLTLGISSTVTIVWVVMMTNAMNFLDNMDGLTAGVSALAAFAFFACILPQGDKFVCVLLMVYAGAVLGFLYHNLNPAKIFMGDAGSMFCGYFLATVSVLGTYYTESSLNPFAVAAPLVVLSVPIFDTLSVVYIRWRRGESIMKGDKRHFSHRLVELGMKPYQAVEFIYLVGLLTGLGAAMLPHVTLFGTIIILVQTTGTYLLIILLMEAGKIGIRDDV